MQLTNVIHIVMWYNAYRKQTREAEAMKKDNLRAILNRVKERETEAEKGNVTYRLTKSIVERFKASCEAQKVVPGHILEEFMKEFADSVSGRK